MVRGILAAALIVVAVSTQSVEAQPKPLRIAGLRQSAIGLTPRNQLILSLRSEDDFDFATKKQRVLLVGGLDGSGQSVKSVRRLLRWFYEDAQAAPLRKRFALSAVASADPDGLDTKAYRRLVFPPQGEAYRDNDHPQAAYLWRWIGMHAPDWVVDVRVAKATSWYVPKSRKLSSLTAMSKRLVPQHTPAHVDGLVSGLVATAACEMGLIPAVQLRCQGSDAVDALRQLLAAAQANDSDVRSPARKEILRRLGRSAIEIAQQLELTYGHDLRHVQYISSLALIGRWRLAQLTNNQETRDDVLRIVSPYFGTKTAGGLKRPRPKSGSELAGHLIFSEMARDATGERRRRCVELVGLAANLAFDAKSKPKPSMPFHSEMSDALFMGGPILAGMGRLTGERRYYDACLRHIEFMQKLVLRDDELYRHSPLDEAAWGRGNGFPALGLAMCLTDFPETHRGRQKLLTAFQNHMKALARHQDRDGCYHQVIDHPESYREFTSTCMITYAITRGLRRGWLDQNKFEPVADRSWQAIRQRIGPHGHLVDVCTGTGKQPNLAAYFNRKAILGRDARGGAMALMVATEIAAWQAESKDAVR